MTPMKWKNWIETSINGRSSLKNAFSTTIKYHVTNNNTSKYFVIEMTKFNNNVVTYKI